MKMRNALEMAGLACMAMAVAIFPMINPAHAAPPEKAKDAQIGIMGSVNQKVDMNTKRAEAAKRLKARKTGAVAPAVNVNPNKTEGGVK